MRCYARNGDEITIDQWIRLMADPSYSKVKLDRINGFHISTVWLGIDQQFGSGPPLIFETMVFSEEMTSRVSLRYTTEEQALIGHEEMCLMVRATT